MFTEEQIKNAYNIIHSDQWTPENNRDKLWAMCDTTGKVVFRRFADELGKMIGPVGVASAEPEEKPKRRRRKKVVDVTASS